MTIVLKKLKKKKLLVNSLVCFQFFRTFEIKLCHNTTFLIMRQLFAIEWNLSGEKSKKPQTPGNISYMFIL